MVERFISFALLVCFMTCVVKLRGKIIATGVYYCDSFLSRMKGLMFTKTMKSAVLVFPRESYASIHMFFVFYPLDIFWLDSRRRVVFIKRNVKPFTAEHSSKRKAKYVLELPIGLGNGIRKGDVISFYR
jgi:uncharacterized protein